MRRIREVRKRDSRVVPFDETKIADAIYAAFRSVGEVDRSLVAELASAVTHFLEEKFDAAIPSIEDIQDVVETVLIQMGHARVAKAYILYRQKRAMIRDTLQVRKVASADPESLSVGGWGDEPGSAESPEDRLLPEVAHSVEGVSSWQKSKIAAALIREADLDPSVAEEIASTVERKVLDSGIQRLSTSLVRELVDNELFERGFSAKLQKQAPLGLPKYNLEQIIFGTDTKEGYAFPKTPLEIRNIIANTILYQYSLQEVFTSAIADAHNDGRIFIHRLSDPIRLSKLCWRLPPPEGAVPAEFQGEILASSPAAYLDLGDFFRRLWHLAHFFSEEIRLTGLDNMLQDPPSRSLPTPARVRAVLERLSQMDSRPDLALEFDLTGDVLPWLEGLLELSHTRPQRFLLAFKLRGCLFSEREAGAVLRSLALLYQSGERMEFLPAGGFYAAGTDGISRELGARDPAVRGRPRKHRLAANVAKITINLPRAAFRSGRDRRHSIETEIEEALDLAIKGHMERRRFIERLGANRENPLWDLMGPGKESPALGREDLEFTIGLLGLNECVKYLTGSELHQDAAALELGLGIVRDIHRKMLREERSLGIRLILEETLNVGPLRALERIDRRKCPQMAEIDRGRSPQWGAAYTGGVRLHRMAPVDPFRRVEQLAEFLRYIDAAGGFVEDFPELRTSAEDLLSSLLEECAPLVAPGDRESTGRAAKRGAR